MLSPSHLFWIYFHSTPKNLTVENMYGTEYVCRSLVHPPILIDLSLLNPSSPVT
jgi:hypothetical protein